MYKTFGKCTQTTDWNYEFVSPLHLIRLLYKVCQYLGPGIRSRLVTPLLVVFIKIYKLTLTYKICLIVYSLDNFGRQSSLLFPFSASPAWVMILWPNEILCRTLCKVYIIISNIYMHMLYRYVFIIIIVSCYKWMLLVKEAEKY